METIKIRKEFDYDTITAPTREKADEIYTKILEEGKYLHIEQYGKTLMLYKR